MNILPKDIHEFLSARVLGQKDVLRHVAVAVHKHVLGLRTGNILLVGNSGTGKTTVMKSIQRYYEATPQLEDFRTMVVVNANILAGDDGEVRTGRLFTALETAVKARLGEDADAETLRRNMENATVCLDEVDKISARLAGKPNPTGIALQQALLTLLEGETVVAPATLTRGERGETVHLPLDTRRMLFLCGGAFEELYNQVYGLIVNRKDDRRLKESTELTRSADGEMRVTSVTRFKLVDHLRLTDMFEYGMLPQFLSRFSTVAILDELGRDDLVAILLTADDSPLRHSREYFAAMGVDLRVTREALEMMAEHALRNTRIGARALREIFSRIIGPAEFDPFGQPGLQKTDSGHTLTVDRAMVTEGLGR